MPFVGQLWTSLQNAGFFGYFNMLCSVFFSAQNALAPFWRTHSRASSAKSALSVPFASRSKSLLPSLFHLCPRCLTVPPFCVFSPPLTIRAIAARGSNMMARKNSASFCIRTELGSYSVSIAWQSSHGASVQKAILRSRNHCEDVCIVTRLRFHF